MPATSLRTRQTARWPWLTVALLTLAAVLAGGGSPATPAASFQAQFAHPAFRTTWERTDRAVASGEARRPWVWGAFPGRSLTEPFAGLPGNAHLVQYFDKGRMELNNPAGDPNDPFFVTNGLLTVELISGLMQTGPNTFENRGPAVINLASDVDDRTAPTYQSFNGVANIPGAPNNRRKDPQIGQVVRTAIDRLGVTQPWPATSPDYGVRIAHYEPTTGHNVPDVFWTYLNQQTDIYQNGQRVTGPLFYPWFSVTGYPISEPYWSYVKVEGRYTDVLIQVYQRRVLTFVPHLPTPFKVQMGNIGMHYYDWRYSPARPAPPPGGATPTSVALPPRANITIDGIAYRQTATDLNGNYATLTNRGQSPQSLNGWWLDSPKWSHVDRFHFPNGVVIQPGASLRVRSGPGNNSATDVYMFRTSPMWDAALYDLAVLYDNFGREVSRFFPAAETGPPPTQPVPPAVTPTTGGRPTSPVVTPVGTATRTPTRAPGQATPTVGLPTPVSTVPGQITTPSPSAAASASPSPTRSPAATTSVTPTRTATATATPTP